MTQDNSVGGRLKTILAEKSEEIVRNTKLPAMLQPEAVKRAIWLKNRVPTKGHEDLKTPWEVLYDQKPDLDRKLTWRSRAYVTLPHELQASKDRTKLHHPRVKLEYFVGCESESIWRIWNPDKSIVEIVSTAHVDDGTGLRDQYGKPTISDIVKRSNHTTKSQEYNDALTLQSSEDDPPDMNNEETPQTSYKIGLTKTSNAYRTSSP